MKTKFIYKSIPILIILIFSCSSLENTNVGLLPLKVSESGRFLVKENGAPFFWLGDTGWKLFESLNAEEATKYLTDRANKGFTVIQCHILPWDLDRPNANGDLVFEDRDFGKPVEGYWQHADSIINKAEELGLYMAILPCWARTYIELKRGKPENKIFKDNPEKAYDYAKFLGNRYKEKNNIIWILGGDEWGYEDTIYNYLAQGLTETATEGDPNKILISFHPQGGTFRPPATSTGEFYHNMEWLDFNMIQSGHRIGNRNFERISEDYKRIPIKPTIDAEPCYEQHPVLHKFENGVFKAWHLRRRGYWSVLAGAFGYTYGGNGIWQMAKPHDKGKASHFNYYWYEAIDFEGGNDMVHLRKLFESRPFINPERIPDQSILVEERDSVDFHIQCARASDYSYWILYITNGCEFEIKSKTLNKKSYNAWWYNPRDGETYNNDSIVVNKPFTSILTDQETYTLNPPGNTGENNDWILILDDPNAEYKKPGVTHKKYFK